MKEELQIHAKISSELYNNLADTGKFRNFDAWIEVTLRKELRRENEIVNLKEGVGNENSEF